HIWNAFPLWEQACSRRRHQGRRKHEAFVIKLSASRAEATLYKAHSTVAFTVMIYCAKHRFT
ncbi:hypothetical protein JWR97_25260, partial [Pseudomonas cedrina subsp. fulgida]|nr:hypothetical protein [Pseudomonas cedrina subsp. fulgida]